MVYKSSPRPSYDGPAHIPAASAIRHLWGDNISGQVSDWCYVSTDKIHQLVLGLHPGGAFRHSEQYKTRFAADELYYVLSGELALANPETGEVHLAKRDQAIFFRRDTWHHGFSVGSDALRVLEVLSPPPSKGSCGEYALDLPDLEIRKYGQDEYLGRWPMAQAKASAEYTMHVIRDADVMWRLEGKDQSLAVAILVSTEHLTVGKAQIRPGDPSTPRVHGGDLALYVLEGTVHVRLPDRERPNYFECVSGDGFYVPEGVPYQLHNVTDRSSTCLFGVAPNYLPDGS